MALKFKEIGKKLLYSTLVFTFLFVGLSLPVQAQKFDKSCVSADDIQLNISNLFQPNLFIPIIPESCASGNGGAKALSLDLLPIIIIRSYGLLASMVFYLFGFNLVLSGIRWSYASFNPSEAGNALKSIQQSGVSMGLVLVSHLIVSTIFVNIFQIKFDTSLGQFFT